MWTTPTKDTVHCIKHSIDVETVYLTFNGKISVGDFNTAVPNLKDEVSSFPPAFVHCYDAALLKESFSDWQYPITVIHDCIRVLPRDMDSALDRIGAGLPLSASLEALCQILQTT